MSALLSRYELTDLFNRGRFQKEPTLAFTTFIYHPHAVEILLADKEMQEIGGCWERDVRAVLEIAQQDGERYRINPNLQIFYTAVAQLENTLPRVKASLEAERAYKARQVVSLYPN